MDKIELTFPELKYQKVTNPISHVIEFDGKYITRRYEFYAEEPAYNEDGIEDRHLPWDKNVYNKSTFTFPIDRLAGIDIYWMKVRELWCVYLYIDSIGEDVKMYFKTEKKATEVHKQILGWWKKYNNEN